MDGGIKLLSNYTKLLMTPDPYFEPFENGVYVLKTNNLILEVCLGQCLITNNIMQIQPSLKWSLCHNKATWLEPAIQVKTRGD